MARSHNLRLAEHTAVREILALDLQHEIGAKLIITTTVRASRRSLGRAFSSCAASPAARL